MWTGSIGITASTALDAVEIQDLNPTPDPRFWIHISTEIFELSVCTQKFDKPCKKISEVKATESCVLERDWKGLAANLFLSISLPFITSFLRWRTTEPGGDVGTMAAADIVSVRPWGQPSGQGQGCSHPLQVMGGPGRFCSLGRGSWHLSTTISGTVDPGQYASGGRLFGPQTQIQFSNPGIPAWKQQ